MDFKVIEAPPSIKGNTAQGGVKAVKIETGTMVNVPLFVETGDIIRINTDTGDYAERVSKG
jgi:elongation factor P